MPIRINLLAEAQGAEELRRKDPVKRACYVAGFVVFLAGLWGLTLLLKIMTTGSDLSTLETQWKSIEKDYNSVVQRQRQAIEAERKLSALRQLTTNRFLWATALNAFQQSMNSVDGVQVTRLRTEQNYLASEETKGRPAAGTAAEKVMNSTEKISVIIEGIDSSQQPVGGQVNKFKEAIATVPYFQQALKTNSVLLTSLSAPQVNESMGGSFVKFTLQCSFPEKVR